MKTLDYYIEVIKVAVPVNLCDMILNEYQNDDSWQNATIGTGQLKLDKRNCETLGLSFPCNIVKNETVRKNLDSEVHFFVSKAMSFYSNKYKVMCETDTGYDLLKYKEGGFFTQHIDESPINNRTVSLSINLNDDYEGGEFAFFDREKVIKLEKGDILMFPSNYIYPHEIMPILKGTRYSIVTWFI